MALLIKTINKVGIKLAPICPLKHAQIDKT